MGPIELTLRTILNEPRWAAPGLLPLKMALGPITRALEDMSQPDHAKWSGAAAEGAAANFDQIRERYERLGHAVDEVGVAISDGNRARDLATQRVEMLPSTDLPWQVQVAANTARLGGNLMGWIPIPSPLRFVGLHVDEAVAVYQQWLYQKREIEAHRVLGELRNELQHHQRRLDRFREEIASAGRQSWTDDTPVGDTDSGWDIPEPTRGDVRYPLPEGFDPGPAVTPNPLPDPLPRNTPAPKPNPGTGDELRVGTTWPVEFTEGTGRTTYPAVPGGPGTGATLPGGALPVPGSGIGDGSFYPPGARPDVDSGSGGSIGNPGLSAGLLGGGALAGGAAMRWGSRAGSAGGQGLGRGAAGPGAPGAAGGAGAAGGPGGTGGLLGTQAAGGAGGARGASGVAGGRGLAGGLPRGAAGAPTGGAGGVGAAGGANGAGAGGAPRGGMMAGGGAGAGGSGSKKGQSSGLGGHIAPKLEDDDGFIPQSDSARAGSREDTE